jgi:hypothetical protein
MGSCACPRCLTPKSLFDNLGLLKDMKNRITNLRAYAMTNVTKAREFIYKSGNTVDGLKVERTLGDGSWVPTVVSTSSPLHFYRLRSTTRRISLSESSVRLASTHSKCLSLILCTSVNLAPGRHFSPTLSDSSMLFRMEISLSRPSTKGTRSW